MGMAEAGHRNATQGIEVAFASGIPYPSPLTVREGDGLSTVGWHHILRTTSVKKSPCEKQHGGNVPPCRDVLSIGTNEAFSEIGALMQALPLAPCCTDQLQLQQ
jgi:hypothetical protein